MKAGKFKTGKPDYGCKDGKLYRFEKKSKLAGVTPNAVDLWERKDGKIGLRKATAGRLQDIRGLGKREVAGILAKEIKGKGKSSRKAKTDR